MLTLPSLRRHGGRRASACRVRASLHGLDSIAGLDLHAALERAEAALYTLADAAVVAADAAAGGGGGGGGGGGEAAASVAQKNGGWFGFISEALEVVLKVSAAVFSQTYRNPSHFRSSGSGLLRLVNGYIPELQKLVW